MKKLTIALGLLLTAWVPAHAQTPSATSCGNPQVPSYVYNNHFYICANGTPLQVDGGGGGATIAHTPLVIKGDNAGNGVAATGADEALTASTLASGNVLINSPAPPNVGNDNVVFGIGAGSAQTFTPNTASTSSYQNVLAGFNAGHNLTTGNFSVLVGASAGFALTGTGTPVEDTIVVAIGAGAAQAMTTGGNDVFVGEDSGSGLLNSSQDVIIGTHAMTPVNGVSSNNVVIGHDAMVSDGGGPYTITGDVVIGQQAAYNATQGNSANVVIGQLAAQRMTTPTSLVVIGQDAAPSLTSGAQNILIGQQVANVLTTGTQNTAIGYQALSNATTASNSIAIGAFAGSDTGANNIEIGGFTGGGNNPGASEVYIGVQDGNGMTGNNNTAVGSEAKNPDTAGTGFNMTLLGANAQTTTNVHDAVQIGAGKNSTSSTAQIFSTQIVNAAGKIPSANLDVAPLPVNNPIFTGTLDGPTSLVGIENLTYHPAACGSLATAPSWCSGTEMGAWINAAYAAGTSPVNISIDPGPYSFTTPIAFGTANKYVTVQWNNALLNYTPTTGTALTITSGGGSTAFSTIYNMQLHTTVSAATTTGVAVGNGTTNADYTRLINPSLGGFQTNLSDNSYGLEIDNPNFQACSSAANSAGISMATSGDDLKVIGGTIVSCVSNFAHTNGNAASFTQTILGGTTSNDVLVNGGGVFKCIFCHYVNPSGSTAHFITNNGLFSNIAPHFENDSATGSSASPIVNTGGMSNSNTFNYSAGQTYTNFINSSPSSWTGNYVGFIQDYGGKIADAYNISTRGDRQISISNPDFEGSNILPPPGWVPNISAVVPAYETSTQQTGKTQSIKFTTNAQFSGLEYQTIFSVVAGESYYLSCAMKSDGTSTPSCVVQFQTNTGAFVANLSVQTSSTSWVTLSSTAVVPSTAVRAVIFLQNNAVSGAGTSYFDQVSIQKPTQATISAGPFLFGASAVNTVVAQATAPYAGHFTNLALTSSLGGTCTTAPTFNVFDGTSSTGTAKLATATTQTKGTSTTQAQTLSFAAGDLIGIYISTAGSGCTTDTWVLSAQYSTP